MVFVPTTTLFAPAVKGATGTLLRSAGPFAKFPLGRIPAELGAMTATGAALHGEIPSPGDIAANAILLGGMHAATKGFGKAIQSQALARTQYSARAKLRELLGIKEDVFNIGKGDVNPEQIYPAVFTRMGRVFYGPDLPTHSDVYGKVVERPARTKSGGLGVQVEPEEVIASGYVADGRYYQTIAEAREAIGKAVEAAPEVPQFTAQFETKTPELSALMSPDYLVKAKGFSWRPAKGCRSCLP